MTNEKQIQLHYIRRNNDFRKEKKNYAHRIFDKIVRSTTTATTTTTTTTTTITTTTIIIIIILYYLLSVSVCLSVFTYCLFLLPYGEYTCSLLLQNLYSA